MFSKIDTKQIILLLVAAICFMSIFFVLNDRLYQETDDFFYSKSFKQKNNLIDTLNKTKEYSEVIACLKLDTILFKQIKSIKVLPTIKIDTSDVELCLIISIEYDNKCIFWKSYDLQSQMSETGQWQTLEQIQNFDNFYFDNQYIIKIYFWNKSKSEYLIKDIRIKLYDEPQKETILLIN